MSAVRRLSIVLFTFAAMAAAACAESTIPWQPSLETARQIAAQSNRLVLVHFWAPWCKACLQLDQEAFSKPETGKALEANFVMVKVNVDEMPATARLYGVSSLPTDAIIAPNGRLVSQIQSPPSAAQYIAQMNRAAEGYRELSRGAGTAVATARATDATSGINAAAASPPVTAVATNANMPVGAAPTASPATVNTPTANTATVNTAAVNTAAAPQSAPSDDRYADYFRQNAAAQAATAQTPPAQNVTPQGAAAAYGNAATAASAPYGNPPAYGNGAAPSVPGAPAAQQQSPYAPQPQTGMNPPPAKQAARPAAPPQPPLPQLPPGCPTIGLEGYCPVTLVEGKQWALGDKTWGVVHRGRTYLFLGPAEKEKFLANPDRYSPVLSGNDPVLAVENQMAVPGRREYGVFGADGRIYLFTDEASLNRFNQNQKRYAAETIQAMR